MRNRVGLGYFDGMSNDTAARPILPVDSVALLDGEHVVIVQGLADTCSGWSHGTMPLYRLDTQARLRVDPARLTVPTATPTVKLTEAQRIVCCYRFQDVATDTDDMGAELRITDPLKALETLDSAIDICADNARGGVAGYRAELGVTKRLRAKVLAAILAA